MNGLLQLKGRFEKRGNEGMGPIGLPANKKVTSEHIEELISQLFKVKEYWADKDDIAGLIVSVQNKKKISVVIDREENKYSAIKGERAKEV